MKRVLLLLMHYSGGSSLSLRLSAFGRPLGIAPGNTFCLPMRNPPGLVLLHTLHTEGGQEREQHRLMCEGL